MAININAEQYGAQFRAFVEFAAQQNNPGHIARIEKPNREAGLIGLEGQPRTITAKNWDGYGQLRGSGSRKVNNEVRTLFLNTILGVCGVDSIEKLPQNVQDVLKAEDFNGKGHPLTARRIKAVTDAVKVAYDVDVKETSRAFVTGSSPAVPRLQEMVMNAPGIPANASPERKVAAFAAKLTENTVKEIVTSIPDQICKTFVSNGEVDFTKEHTQFANDLKRDLKVYIDNGVARKEIPGDYERVRDKIVQFITGDDKGVDTFASVSESVRRQTAVLMSLMNQCTSTSVMNGFLKTVQKDGGGYQFSDFGSTAGTNLDFTLTRNADDSIQISFSQANGCGVMTLLDGKGTEPIFMDGATSCCRVGVEINLSADKLKDVADADWTALDFNAFKAEGQKVNLDGQIALMPPQLRLDAKITVSAHFELNPAQNNPMDIAQGV